MSDLTAGDARVPERRSAQMGRRARAVDAFIDLVLEGHFPPSSEQVAERAGISMATLFRYFESLDQLRRDAAARTMARFPLFEIPDTGANTRDARIARFVAGRVELWEQIHPLALFQRSNVLHDPGAAEMVDLGRKRMTEQIRHYFGVELRELTSAQRDDLVTTIASLTALESWEQFRHTFDRSPMQTRRAWCNAIGRLLEGH